MSPDREARGDAPRERPVIPRVELPNRTPRMTMLLVIALITVTVFPILIFATDLTNWRVLQSLRERALHRAGVSISAESQNARRERKRQSRANIHPRASTAATSMAFQLAVLIVLAVVGRRLFALRL